MAQYPTDYRGPWIDDDGFLCIRTGSERRTRAALEHDLAIASKLAANGRLRTIWDARAATTIDIDAWVPLIDRLSSIVEALAVLVSDMTTTQALAFRTQIDALLLPCRAFPDEESATAWLKSVKI